MRSYSALVALFPALMTAGVAARAQTGAPRDVPISVYLDCRLGCDNDYLRTEITFVNWVRDREVADVQVLITGQGAGGGGREFTLAFIGLRALAGRGDTLTFTTNATTTGDEVRSEMMQTIALGLVQFAARTGAGRSLRVSVAQAGARTARQMAPADDPWKAWVFRVSVNGSTSGERAYSSRDVRYNFNANRVTAAWKTNASYNYSYRYSRSTAPISGERDTTFVDVFRDWNTGILQVKSVTNHVSLGAFAEAASQLFRNYELRYAGRAAVEVNLFPYAEATRRELSFRYSVGPSTFNYVDTTIFGKIRETLLGQALEATYRTQQPWGSASVNAEHRNYLKDAALRVTELNGDANIRIYRGLSVNVGASYEWINDQIYLRKGGLDLAGALLRRRAVLTSYQYFMHAGFGFTFGSIFNNVVNPRF